MHAVIITGKHLNGQQLYLTFTPYDWDIKATFGKDIEFRELTQEQFNLFCEEHKIVPDFKLDPNKELLQSVNPPTELLNSNGKIILTFPVTTSESTKVPTTEQIELP